MDKLIISRVNGVVYILLAAFITVLLAAAGFIVWIQRNNSAKIEAYDKARALSLTGLRAYANLFCNNVTSSSDDAQINKCHKRKFRAAIAEIRRFIDSSDNIFYNLPLNAPNCFPANSNLDCINVHAGRYYEPNVPGNDDDEPLWARFVDMNPGQFANSFRIQGCLQSSRFDWAFRSVFQNTRYSSGICFDAIASSLAMAGFLIGDLSKSVTEATHFSLGHIDRSYRSNLNYNPWLQNPNNNNAYNTSGPQDFIVQPSFFAYPAILNSSNQPELYDPIGLPQETLEWNRSYDLRTQITAAHRKLQQFHPKEDYVLVDTYKDTAQAYSDYSENDRAKHVAPGDSPYVNNNNSTETTDKFLLDLFRRPDDGYFTYKGAEPLRSVLLAEQYALRKFIERAQPGDLISFIFYGSEGNGDGLSWARTGKLTNDYDYWVNVLDVEDFDSPRNFNNADVNRILDFSITPPWIKLGLFSRSFWGTNTIAALHEAYRQLSITSPDAIKFIGNFSDGLPTCYTVPSNLPNPPRVGGFCGNGRASLIDSLNEIEQYFIDVIEPSEIKFHMFMPSLTTRGFRVFWNREDPNPDFVDGCRSDNQTRIIGEEYIASLGGHRNITQQQWLKKYYNPIAQVGGFWWKLVSWTDGVWDSHYFKIDELPNLIFPGFGDNWLYQDPFWRRSQYSCENYMNTTCYEVLNGHPDTYWGYHDQHCKTLEQRAQGFVDRIFDTSSRYQIIETPPNIVDYSRTRDPRN